MYSIIQVLKPTLTRELKIPYISDILVKSELRYPIIQGDKISVGVARPSHVLGQSVPCDR